jgi:hypothetical protein
MNNVLPAEALAPDHTPAAGCYPEFFGAAPVITLYDPLAEFLGAVQGGLMTYRYTDAVALAGHSCPTVASAFLMTRAALSALYRNDTPERGAIRVEFRDDQTAGVTGVMANVVRLITGSTQQDGFKGIGGRFDRRDLLAFGVDMRSQLRFTRTDTGVRVGVSAQLDRVPMDPRVSRLLPRCLAGDADTQEIAEFHRLWQGRVRSLLLDHKDDPQVFVTGPD